MACQQGPANRRTAPGVCTHAVATEPAVVGSAFQQPAGKGLGFYTGDDGYLYCDGLRVDDIRDEVLESPFYLYSKDRVTANYAAYAQVGPAPCCRSIFLSTSLTPQDIHSNSRLTLKEMYTIM